jgi:hypothetical protein
MNVWLYSLALAIPAAAVLMVLELGISKLIYRAPGLALVLFGSAKKIQGRPLSTS